MRNRLLTSTAALVLLLSAAPAWAQSAEGITTFLDGEIDGLSVLDRADQEKELHWLGWFEEKLGNHGNEGLSTLLTLLAVYAAAMLVPEEAQLSVLLSGVGGVAIYLAVNFLSGMLEGSNGTGEAIKTGSIGGFLYLEVLDASFSFDGVIGAFAITKDVVIIMIGLAIGAFFVRSMTIYLVRKGTLEAFVYLEHGAHYAIGILAAIMLISIKYHVPEWFTGLSGVAFIGLSLWSSVRYKRAQGGASAA